MGRRAWPVCPTGTHGEPHIWLTGPLLGRERVCELHSQGAHGPGHGGQREKAQLTEEGQGGTRETVDTGPGV